MYASAAKSLQQLVQAYAQCAATTVAAEALAELQQAIRNLHAVLQVAAPVSYRAIIYIHC